MLENYFYVGCILLSGAILLDLLVGDPRWLPHPVIQMGKLISFLEKKWNREEKRRLKGVFFTGIVVLTVYFLTFLIVSLAYQLHLIAGIAVEICLISTTIAIKGLASAARAVATPLAEGNLIKARRSLSMIVGRDTDKLPEREIVRGTVETVAENTVDGITAPLFWALIGGAPLAMAYRAINTLDSMVGYKNEQFNEFGWASARLDDAANWLPARITVFAIWLSAFFMKGARIKQAWVITWRDARKHPSPNSGWTEAMTAGLLGVQLGGINYYKGKKSARAVMGEPIRTLVISDIEQSIRYMHGGWIGCLVFFLMILYVT